MLLEPKCGNCKHRGPRNICTEVRSPRNKKLVDPNDCCDYFLENPAEGHFLNGLTNVLEANPRMVVQELSKAIALGLPHDAEMQAHYFLGSAYHDIASASDLSAEQMVEMLSPAIREHETGILMDRDGKYGYFSVPINRAHLQAFDGECALVAAVLAERQGSESAIAYLERQLRVCDHLSSSPMIQALLNLGVLYAENDEKEKAANCFTRILEAEPVDMVDEQGSEAQTRQMAKKNLYILTENNVPSSTGANRGAGCMFALMLAGSALVVSVASCYAR